MQLSTYRGGPNSCLHPAIQVLLWLQRGLGSTTRTECLNTSRTRTLLRSLCTKHCDSESCLTISCLPITQPPSILLPVHHEALRYSGYLDDFASGPWCLEDRNPLRTLRRAQREISRLSSMEHCERVHHYRLWPESGCGG